MHLSSRKRYSKHSKSIYAKNLQDITTLDNNILHMSKKIIENFSDECFFSIYLAKFQAIIPHNAYLSIEHYVYTKEKKYDRMPGDKNAFNRFKTKTTLFNSSHSH